MSDIQMKKQHLLIALGLLVLSSCNNTNTPSNCLALLILVAQALQILQIIQ